MRIKLKVTIFSKAKAIKHICLCNLRRNVSLTFPAWKLTLLAAPTNNRLTLQPEADFYKTTPR
jgi:hypothetical protein